MAYDGQPYNGGTLVYPDTYQPGAPMAGGAFSQSLENLYYLGRNQSRVVFQQSYAWNATHPTIYTESLGFAIIAGAHTHIAEGYAYVPLEATHLRAWILFGGIPLGSTVANHRIGITGGPVGATVEQAISPAQFGSNEAAASSLIAYDWSPGASPVDSASAYRSDVEVSLDGVTLDDVLHVYVEGCLVAANATAYRPLFIACAWECR